MYSKTYMTHFASPQNIGQIDNPDAECEVINTEGGCFDKVQLQASFDGDTVSDAKFRLKACSGTIMSFSLLTTMIKGKTIDEIEKIDYNTLEAEVGGIPEKKAHSLRLAVEAKDKIISQYKTKTN